MPGAILSETPRRVAITPRGKEIDLWEEIGMSISIPRNAAVEDDQIDLAASFSGTYDDVLPENVESVSPTYTIHTSKGIQFSKDVTVTLQHTANLETMEDHEAVVVLASSTPFETNSGCRPVHHFKEVQEAQVQCNARYVVMKVKGVIASIFKVGKKKRKGIPKG